MADRLNSLDVSFLYLEETTTPMHVGSVAIFQPPEEGFDYDRLVKLIKGRIALVPRFRQRVRWVPGGLANPVWVDDESFDVTYHVRRSALPKPGTEAQLRELVGRIMSRPLDRSRPLWEMYLVEGLEGGRFAILSKTHHAMVDGISAVDIGQVILDVDPEPRKVSSDEWRPSREPTGVELMAGAVGDIVKSPANAVDNVRSGLADLHRTASSFGKHAVGIAAAAMTVARSTPTSPLNAEIGEQRRYATAHAKLSDLKEVRRAHGGTVNDVVLAITAGALRAWLMTRGEAVGSRAVIRAMVPVSVRDDEDSVGGNRVAAFLVDLPVGEPDPVVRLQRISFDMAQHKESGQMLGAEAIVAIAGFAPPTLHAMGARVGSDLSKRVYNLVITNVPGPQFPLYAGGALMLAAYPIVPLAKNQAVSIGLTSYNGGVYFGLNADRDAMPDVDVLAQCLTDATEELKDTARPSRRSAGRRPKVPLTTVSTGTRTSGRGKPVKKTTSRTTPRKGASSTPKG